MQLNPFKGGKYDWSQAVKSGYYFAADPDYRKKALANARSRISDNGFQFADLMPQTIYHAQAAEITPQVAGASTQAGSVPGDMGLGQYGPDIPTDPFVDAANAGQQAAAGSQVLGFATLPNGRTYNLDNPSEKQAFFEDKLGLLTEMRDQEIAKGKKASDENLAQIDQEIQDTYGLAKQYVEDYNKNVNSFGDQYQMGNVKRQQFFAGLSPNAFQSSQGTSQKYAENQYLQGLGDMAQEAQSNVGANFLANPNDINKLEGASIYGRNIGALRGQKTDVANAFNDYYNSTQQDVQNQAADLSTSLSGTNAFKYDRTKIAAPTANKADVSKYQPYTTFQQGNVQVPVGQTNNTIYTPNAFNSQTPIDTFLGRNQLDTKQKDYLKSYLLGKA